MKCEVVRLLFFMILLLVVYSGASANGEEDTFPTVELVEGKVSSESYGFDPHLNVRVSIKILPQSH